MRFKQFLESESFSDDLKVGDRVFSMYEQYVSYTHPDERTYQICIDEGEEFIITRAEVINGTNYIFFKDEYGEEFHTTEQRIKIDFGRGTWKDYKRKWINSLKEAEEWMDWRDVQVGKTYTKVDTILPMIGHAKDWKETYQRLHDEARVQMPIGTQVVVTDIAELADLPYVEFKTEDGKQYFLADDAFCLHFYNGSLRDWNMKFFNGLKEDGPFKKKQYQPFERGAEIRARKSFYAELLGKKIEIRGGSKIRFVREIDGKVIFRTTGMHFTNQLLSVDKEDFMTACGVEVA